MISSLVKGPKLVQRALHAHRRAMTSSSAPLLVTPSQIRDLSPAGNICLLDASWHMPNSPRNAREEFLSKRVGGANFLDLDEVASPSDLGLKHMMPEERVFADACGMYQNVNNLIVIELFCFDREVRYISVVPCCYVCSRCYDRRLNLLMT